MNFHDSLQDRAARPLAALHPTTSAELRAELCRAGVERMLAQALEVEAELHTSRHRDQRDESGKRRVVRNGYLPPREIVCGAGAIRVHQPRVNDSRLDAHGRRRRFSSSVLPAYARNATCIGCPSAEAVLYGLATGDMSAAFLAAFGSVVDDLPQSFVPRLGELWGADRDRLSRRAFHGYEPAQVWADAVPVPAGVREAGEGNKASLALVATTPEGVDVLGVRLGRAERVESWSELFAGLADRGFVAREDRLHASAPEAARAAFARQARG